MDKIKNNVKNKINECKNIKITFSVLFLSILLAFFIGFSFGGNYYNVVGFVKKQLGIHKSSFSDIDMSSLAQTYQALQDYYVGSISKEKALDGLNKGLVDSLDDPYTTYMDKKEAEDFEKTLVGDVGAGIGVEVGVRNHMPTILRVLRDHPAKKVGVEVGDVIYKVNNENVLDKGVSEVVNKIKGKEGTKVKVSFIRKNKEVTFDIERKTINNPSVEYSVDNKIGVLRINRFDGETYSLVLKAKDEFLKQKIRGIIVDLRGNGGGYLDAATNIASLWLGNKVIVGEKGKDGNMKEVKGNGIDSFKGIETKVIIDSSSASASEILAGALKDYGVAKIIGEKSFGKGSVQTVIDLKNDAKLKVTIAKWFTPRGKNIDKQGIEPNEKIQLTENDLNSIKDVELEKVKNEFK